MDKNKIKDALKAKLKKEMSMTGTGASLTPGGDFVASKYAFKKKVKEDAPQLAAGKVKDNYAVSHFGFTDAPSIPNRKSKAIDYKQLWEGELKLGVKYDYKGDSGFISTGGSNDPKNWMFLGSKGKYPYLSVKADLVPSEKQPGKYDGAFDAGMGKGHHIDEVLEEGKIHIGTETKTDSAILFEPETGAFYINVIDAAGNRTNKLPVNTIDDVLFRFPNWKWTEAGKAEFADTLDDYDEYSELKSSIKRWYKDARYNPKSPLTQKWVDEFNAKVDSAKTKDELKALVQGELIGDTSSTMKKLGLDEAYEHVRYLASDLKNLYYNSNNEAFKKAVVDAIPDGNQYQYYLTSPEKYIQKLEVLKQMLPQARVSDVKGAMNIINNAIEFFQNKETIQEGYAQFRNATKQRSKPDQFHQAVKEVKRKMSEINRLFEYMDRLKTELSEGEDLKYKKYTENALQQIKENAKALFFKSTKLK